MLKVNGFLSLQISRYPQLDDQGYWRELFFLLWIKCIVHYTPFFFYRLLLVASFIICPGFEPWNIWSQNLLRWNPGLQGNLRNPSKRKKSRSHPCGTAGHDLASFTSISPPLWHLLKFCWHLALTCFYPLTRTGLSRISIPTLLSIQEVWSDFVATGSPGSCHSTRAQYSLRGWDNQWNLKSDINRIVIYFRGRMAMSEYELINLSIVKIVYHISVLSQTKTPVSWVILGCMVYFSCYWMTIPGGGSSWWRSGISKFRPSDGMFGWFWLAWAVRGRLVQDDTTYFCEYVLDSTPSKDKAN